MLREGKLKAPEYATTDAAKESRTTPIRHRSHQFVGSALLPLRESRFLSRAARGFRRPLTPPDSYLDEAETSIYASFLKDVWPRDRADLIEDARDRLTDWLAFSKE